MSSQKKQFFLDGFGSLSQSFAPVDFSQHIKYSSAEERMESHWQRVGDSIRRSISSYEKQISSKKD